MVLITVLTFVRLQLCTVCILDTGTAVSVVKSKIPKSQKLFIRYTRGNSNHMPHPENAKHQNAANINSVGARYSRCLDPC